MADVNIKINLITGQAQRELGKLNASLKKINNNISGNNGAFGSTSKKKTTDFAKSLGRVTDIAKGIISANLFFAIGRQIRNAMTTSITAFVQFEQAMIGVARTADLTDKELEALSDTIGNLGTELPIPRTELAKIAQIAGQLGVRGTKNLAKFTKTIAQLTIATDLTSETAALALTRILNLTEEPIDNIDRLGSAIVDIGNNFAATEPEIVSLSSEIARATTGFGLSSTEIIGLGGALRSLGVNAESGGTAVGRVFREIDKAIATGGPRLKEFANIIGISTDELTTRFKDDALSVFVEFVKGAKELEKSGQSIGTTLNTVGLNTDRLSKVLRPAVGRVDELERGLQRASFAAEKNTAASKEAERAIGTLGSAYGKFKTSLANTTSDILEPLAGDFETFFSNLASELETRRALNIEPEGLEQTSSTIELLNRQLEIYNNTIEKSGKKQTEVFIKQSTQYKQVIKRLEELNTREDKLRSESDAKNERSLLLAEKRSGARGASEKVAQDKRNETRTKAEQETNLKLEEIRAQNRLLLAEERLIDAGVAEEDRKLALLVLEANEQQKLDIIRKAEAQKQADAVKSLQEKEAILLKVNNKINERKLKDDKNIKEATKELSEDELKGKRNISSAFTSLANAENKELAAIGKAGAIAQIAIDTPKAVSSSFAYGSAIGGPPLGFVFGAIAAAFQAQQAANVAGLKFQEGGIVPGNSNTGDNVTARVNSGEMILNRQQQANLFQQANNGGSGGQSDVPLQNNITVEVDGEAITKVVSRSVANGAVLGEVGV